MTDDDCQNPLYPQDAGLTVPEMEAVARAGSMERAQSPGELICIVDNTSSDAVPVITHDLAHSYQELMDYRHANVIADDAPWTYWTLSDVWAASQPPLLPPSPGPPPPDGWNWQARVNPYGISEPDIWSPMITAPGYTYVVQIDPSVVLLASPGFETRLLFTGGLPWVSGAHLSDVYVGEVVAPWVASQLHHVTFNGGYNDVGGVLLEQITDPIPVGINASRGLLVSFVVQAGVVGGRQTEPGWALRLQAGNHAADLDKSGAGWTPGTWASVGVLTVDGFYVAGTSATSELDAGDYLLGNGSTRALAFSGKASRHGQSRASADRRLEPPRTVSSGHAGSRQLWRPGGDPHRR